MGLSSGRSLGQATRGGQLHPSLPGGDRSWEKRQAATFANRKILASLRLSSTCTSHGTCTTHGTYVWTLSDDYVAWISALQSRLIVHALVFKLFPARKDRRNSLQRANNQTNPRALKRKDEGARQIDKGMCPALANAARPAVFQSFVNASI